MSTPTPAAETDARPATRLRADSRAVVYSVVVLVAALGLTSLVASFQGLLTVASWALLPTTLRWTVPVSLDGAILVYTAVALVRRDRGESSRAAWTAVAAGTALSAAANALHVVATDPTVIDPTWVRGIGAGVAALAPVLAAFAVHALADLAVAPPVKRSTRRPATAPVRRTAPVTTPAATALPETPVSSSAPVPAPTPARRPAAPVASRPVSTAAQERAEAARAAAEPLLAEGRSREEVAAVLAAQGHSQRPIAEAVGASKTAVARWLASETTPTAGVAVPA